MAPPVASNASLGELYSKCVQMVNENKISIKNAFDLHLIDHMDDIVDSFMGGRKRKAAATSASSSGGGRSSKSTGSAETEEENRFHEASCTIEASARIYACRVDCVHTDTYRVLGGLSSADMDEDDGQGGEKGAASKRRRICGVNTLERNEANIIQHAIEADEQSDPMFRRMAAAFDAGGAKGLLLSHLPVAEDLSLVFNGDVPLNRAAQTAQHMFERVEEVPAEKLGLGDPVAACAKLASAKLCPGQLDAFRRQLWGDVESSVSLPAQLEALLGPQGEAALPPTAAAGRGPAAIGQAPPMMPITDGEDLPLPPPAFDDAPEPELDAAPFAEVAGAPQELGPDAAQGELAPLPLEDAEVKVEAESKIKEDVIAFDELFEKFCGGGGSHQFAYFDECWAKLPSEKEPKQQIAGALADAEGGALVLVPDGQVQPVERKTSKRPLFDLANLDKPIKPIETEPVHKHQLSERAAHWQLHKDVPPYMIDRITMPSWQTWSKCDFACLGLRPHLMLKLVRKGLPVEEGPHSFSDLFSTVVVENPEAFSWLGGSSASSGSHARGDDADDDARGGRDGEFADEGADEDFDANGLPPHLDVDPQELFLRPGDKVVPGIEQTGDFPDLPDMGVEDTFGGTFGAGEDAPFMAGLDFDLADRPQTVGNTEIGYSRNSKFVDVKLVKKHLWDCISEDISHAKPQKAASSFQGLVDRTVQRLPKVETENLSVAVCFICALHLCNEKGLELQAEKTRPLGDFDVAGPP